MMSMHLPKTCGAPECNSQILSSHSHGGFFPFCEAVVAAEQ